MHYTSTFSVKGENYTAVYNLIRVVLLCIALVISATLYAQKPFITTWKTDNPGTSNNRSITIPTQGGGYNFEVDWNNDGIYDQSGLTGDVFHEFAVVGTYTIRIRGSFPRLYFNAFFGDTQKLLDVKQWGDLAWTSMDGAFAGCVNLTISATDIPNLAGVKSMARMFLGCHVLTGPSNIGNWNTGNVSDMSQMFSNAKAFNQLIGSWNLAKVTNTNGMFNQAQAFNQPIGNWNTAKVTDMGGMFSNASAFNQPIGNWNTENVTDMSRMFINASSFNQPIDNWNTLKVTDMSFMFNSATSFNQFIGKWSLSPEVNLQSMLSNSGIDCEHYSTTLIGWSDNPSTPNGRFLGASGRLYGTNAIAARTNLDVTKGWAFGGDGASGIDCSPPPAFTTTWKTDNFGTSNKTSITIPTTGAGYNYEVDWDNDGTFDQSGIAGDVTHDFGVAGIYTIRIKGAFPRIFFNNSGDRQKLLDVKQWGDIAWASMEYAFNGCSNLDISATDLPNLTGVTSLEAMFSGCKLLNGPANIGDWNTTNVTNMFAMFYDAWNFNQPVGKWNTSKVTNMHSLFAVAHAFNQPIGSWNTANVTDMKGMFGYAYSFNQPIESWNTAQVTDMTSMFSDADAFNQSIGSWNTSNVTNMFSMFNGADVFNKPIDNWNVAKVTDMSFMFSSAVSFNQSLGKWALNPGVSLISMLDYSGMDCAHYSETLIGWYDNPDTPDGLSLGATEILYGTNALGARTKLDVAKNWTFTGDAPSGTDCSSGLPVVLISFMGKSQENGILLAWQTSSETNNAGFEIERSIDAKTFQKIGFVDGNGDVKEQKSYHFTDTSPLPVTFYRLKQLDLDGKFEYSRIISVKRPEKEVTIYPNPASDAFYLKGLDEKQNLVVRDIKGNVVQKLMWSPGKAIQVDKLRNGQYFISVAGLTRKIIVKK